VTAPALRPGTGWAGGSEECSFWFERLREDLNVLNAVVESLAAARADRSSESTRAVLYARLEVTADAVVGAFTRLWGQPADRTRCQQDPVEEGGLLVQ
jgi:hypothetical protein